MTKETLQSTEVSVTETHKGYTCTYYFKDKTFRVTVPYNTSHEDIFDEAEKIALSIINHNYKLKRHLNVTYHNKYDKSLQTKQLSKYLNR